MLRFEKNKKRRTNQAVDPKTQDISTDPFCVVWEGLRVDWFQELIDDGIVVGEVGVNAIAFRHKDVPCMVLCSHFVRQSEPSDEACDGCQKKDRKIKSFLILSQSALLQDP